MLMLLMFIAFMLIFLSRQALRWLRGPDFDVGPELAAKAAVAGTADERPIAVRKIKKKSNEKRVLISTLYKSSNKKA